MTASIPQLAETLGDAFLRSALLSVAGAIALTVLRRRSAAVRHAATAWVVCGMLSVACLNITLGTAKVPVTIAPRAALEPPTRSEGWEPDAGTVTALAPQMHEAADAAREDPLGPSTSPGRAAPPIGRLVWPPWGTLFTAAWAAVAVALSIRTIVGHALSRRLVQRSQTVEFPRWLQDIAGHRPPGLRESAAIAVPLAIGWLRPVILLPAGWREWDSSRLRAVLVHELTHIRRGDWPLALLAALNRTVFWFYPVAWWLERQMGRLAEEACDDACIRELNDRAQYARTLLEMARLAGARHRRLNWEAVAMAGASRMSARLARVLDETRAVARPMTRTGWLATALCAVPLVCAIAVLQLVPVQAALPVAVALAAASAPAPSYTAEPEPQQAQPAPAPATTNPEELCSVSGVVLNEVTGEPVKYATVILAQSADSSPGVPTGGYTIETDAAGRYAAERIQPGRYRMMARRPGFLITDYGGKPRTAANGSPSTTPRGKSLDFGPGQKAQNVDFKLQPYTVLAGRVVGANGEPLAGVTVTALMAGYDSKGKKTMFTSGGSEATNDLGEFRMSPMPPGQYYLCATAGSPGSSGAAQDASAKPPQEGYVATYYPSVTSAPGVAVDVAAGRATEGVSIKMARASYTQLRGRIVNQTGLAGASVRLLMYPLDASYITQWGRVTGQGEFEFRRLAPGTYRLVAQQQGPTATGTAERLIEVGRDPIEGLTLVLSPGIEISGSLKIEDDGKTNPQSMTVLLATDGTAGSRQLGGGQVALPARPTADGSFKMGPCAPGSYLASVRPLPYGYYLKSAKLGDRDVLGGIDLTSGGGGRLELVVSGKGGRVSGLVKDESGSAAAGATVVLIPENTVLRTSYSLFPRVTADATGAFTVNSVPPGNYKAFAWADWEGFAYMNAEYMRPIEGKGVALKVEESGSYTASLQTIPASGVTP